MEPNKNIMVGVAALILIVLFLVLRTGGRGHNDNGGGGNGTISCEPKPTRPAAIESKLVPGNENSLANFDGYIMETTGPANSSTISYLPLKLNNLFAISHSSSTISLVMDLTCAILTLHVNFDGEDQSNLKSKSSVSEMNLDLNHAKPVTKRCKFIGITDLETDKNSHLRCNKELTYECLLDNSELNKLTLVIRNLEFEIGGNKIDSYSTPAQDCQP